jgi:hypothetical protein
MNGYLNNLAIRTMNAGNLVEPRMPSLFESQRVAESTEESPAYTPVSVPANLPGPLIETPPDTRPAATDSKHEIAPPVEAPAIVTDQPADFAEARPVSTPPHVATRGASVVQSRANTNQAALKPVVGDSPIERIAEPTNRTVEPTRRILEPAAGVDETAAEINERVETMTVSTTSPSPIPLPRAAASPGIAPKKSADAQLIESSTSESAKSPSEQTATTPTPQVSERIVERVSTTRIDLRSLTRAVTSYARREPFTPEHKPEPEPSINVTIGRVEVRATPITTPKSKTARSESSVMPLEEYLQKQRRGDSR